MAKIKQINGEPLEQECVHKWKGAQAGGHPADEGSYEWVCFCERCGIEKTDD